MNEKRHAWQSRSSIDVISFYIRCLALVAVQCSSAACLTANLVCGASWLGGFQLKVCLNLVLVANTSLCSSANGQVTHSRLWVSSQKHGWVLDFWVPTLHLAKIRTKVKRKWCNFLSHQNAIISPRATNLLGRRSWFAYTWVINCICKWQNSLYSCLKGRCWLSLVFVWQLFSEHFYNSLLICS